VPTEVQLIGATLILVTYYTTYRIALENQFAVAVVKVQRARGHKVIDTRSCRYVEHPMYTGLIFREIATPLLLGSWWGLCQVNVIVIIVVIRLLFEERALGSGSEGCDQYVERVPYRLIPLVW